jgi:hypothetical protein
MGIDLSAEKYEELIGYKLKVADSDKKAEESLALVTDLRAELESLSDSKDKIDSLTAEKTKFNEDRKVFIDAVIASGVKAYGAGKDENAEKYASMGFEELITSYESNIAVYCDNLNIGENTQSESAEQAKNQYVEATRVAAALVN